MNLFKRIWRWIKRVFGGKQPVKCENCNKPSDVKITWGLYEYPKGQKRNCPMNTAHFCWDCSNQLWDMLRGSVNAGEMHWQNGPPDQM